MEREIETKCIHLEEDESSVQHFGAVSYPTVSYTHLERVQKMLKINHDAPARGKAQNFLLTTKLFCGLCGSPMIGDGGTSHTGKAYAYYSCTKRKRGRSCKKESVPKDWIEDLSLIHI